MGFCFVSSALAVLREGLGAFCLFVFSLVSVGEFWVVLFFSCSSPFPSSRPFLSSTDLRGARRLWDPGGAPLSAPAAAVCPTLGDGRHRLCAGGESRAEKWSSPSNRRCSLSPAPPPPLSSSCADSFPAPRPRSAGGAASAARPWDFFAALYGDIPVRGDPQQKARLLLRSSLRFFREEMEELWEAG